MSYSIFQVWLTDMRGLAQIDTLLECEGIRRDKNLTKFLVTLTMPLPVHC